MSVGKHGRGQRHSKDNRVKWFEHDQQSASRCGRIQGSSPVSRSTGATSADDR